MLADNRAEISAGRGVRMRARCRRVALAVVGVDGRNSEGARFVTASIDPNNADIIWSVYVILRGYQGPLPSFLTVADRGTRPLELGQSPAMSEPIQTPEDLVDA